LNRGRHLYSAGRPSRWASAHILVFTCSLVSFDLCLFHYCVFMNWLRKPQNALRKCELVQRIYTVGHKKQPIYFCLRQKSTDFNAVFAGRFRNECCMLQCELHPPRLINVVAVPCESRNTENVILQRDIVKEICIKCVIALSKWTRVIIWLAFTYLECLQQWVHETKIHGIMT